MKNLIIIICIILAGCSYEPLDYETKDYTVKYVLTCSSTASLTYEAKSGTAQESNRSSGWQYSFTTYGRWLYLSAQNDSASGSVTVSIYVNNQLYKTVTSSGGFVIATVSGTPNYQAY